MRNYVLLLLYKDQDSQYRRTWIAFQEEELNPSILDGRMSDFERDRGVNNCAIERIYCEEAV